MSRSATNTAIHHAAAYGSRSHKAAPIVVPMWNGTYDGAELKPFTGRAGAMDAFTFPSRMGSKLHYRDGRVTEIGA